MSGCKVAGGDGIMLVTSVGINTEYGLLMACISEDSDKETPLQVRLNGVANLIGKVGLSVASLVLVVLIARFFTGHTKNPDGTVQFLKGHTSVKDAINGAAKILAVAVTIVVIAVPEDLPLVVTLTLAYLMRKMLADKALVRKLSACETMGCATAICCDKTGILTLNRMTVVKAHVGGIKLSSPDDGQELSSSVSSMLFESIAQNTTGNVYKPEDGGLVVVTDSATENAILSWAVKLGMKFDEVRSKTSILHIFPFNSEKKHGGVAVHVEGSEVHVHWKGAAEIVLSSCTNWLDSNGQLQEMTPNQMDAFKLCIEDMAAGSLRCVAIAYRLYEMENVPEQEERDRWALPESDLILLGIVGIEDPCRPGVREAVDLLIKAGVKVCMVTGDSIQTAKAIALECGILHSQEEAIEPTIIEGRVFRSYSEETREEFAEKISVMGRSSPNDKLLLVQALRKKGHVVAVFGNDTNDARALHEGDVSLAMGIEGTEVAKESSDIIILDDNFASVVKIVRWGRSVYANIQKFIQFRLTFNVAVLVINVLSAVSSGEVLLNTVELLHLGFLISGRRFSVCMSHAFAVIVFQVLSFKRHERIRCYDNNQCQQLLWVSLIMDTLGVLALATEPPTDQLMMRPPVGRGEPLVTNIMWRNLFVQALYQGAILVVLNFGGKSLLRLNNETREHADKVINTFIFNTFVFCQLFNEFNARKPEELNVFKGVTKNRLFMGMIGITLLLQILIIEFLGKFFSTVRLSWQLWMASVGIAFISWPLAIAGKMFPVPKISLGEYCRICFWKQPSRGRQLGQGQGMPFHSSLNLIH